MKYIFIINPTAGAGRGKRIGSKIEEIASELDDACEIYYTTRKHEATEIALRYKNEENVIFSVGGDGTLFEVVNGIVNTKNMLGIIPAGSGNDFYRSLVKRDELMVYSDVGVMNNLYFLNSCSIGIDAEICSNAELMKKRHVSPSQIYNASILYTFFKYKFRNIDFVLNKTKKSGEYTLVAVMNGCSYGGGFEIAPNADISDGLFDIYFADKLPKSRIPSLLLKLKNGTHEESPDVHKRLSDGIKFRTKEKVAVQVDGEIVCDNKFNISIKKKALKIYNNKNLVNDIVNNIID